MGDRSIDDEDFDYGNQDIADDEDGHNFTQRSQVVQNQPHDEEVALSETESLTGRGDAPPSGRGNYGNMDASLIESGDDMGMPVQANRESSGDGYTRDAYDRSSQQYEAAPPAHLSKMSDNAADDDGGEDDAPAGGYNAMEFKHLNVSDEIRELFKHIGRYKPHTIDLNTQLKPFIPDYIPSVGGIDEFIKVPRPDGKPDYLGLKVLDEPASRQSDPTVLTLQLRQLSKEAPGNNVEMVGRIEHTDDNKAKKVQQWISSIADIHKSKPAATVSYSRRMPDIEALMQEWPPEMEAFLRNMKMPSGELDLDLATYAKTICGILDIPVYDNVVESLHVLFTLFLEFKSNPIFAGQQDFGNMTMSTADEGGMGMQSMGGMGSTMGGANVMTF